MEVVPNMFEARRSKGEQYQVSIVSRELQSALDTLAETSTDDRGGLATQNMSHSKSVRGSMLIVRQNDNPPEVIVFDYTGEYAPNIETKRNCLIIENAESFLFYKNTYEQLCVGEDELLLVETDIFYAAGNSITNKLHKPLLMRYEKLYLALDIDLGGLTIAQTLKRAYGDDNVMYMVPKKLEEKLTHVVQEKSEDYLAKVEKIKLSTPSLKTPCNYILRTRKTLEQESTLYD
jgi:hypothetical protein